MKFFSLLMLMSLVSCGFEVVDTGRRGVKVSYGKVIGEPLPEGLHFYSPFTEDIEEMNVREQAYEYKLESYSKDNQPINMTVVVVAGLIAKDATLVYAQYGDDFFEAIASKEIIGGIKDIVGKYTADNIVSQRGQLRAEATKYLSQKLAERHIIVSGVDFTNLKFDDAYEQAVQTKVVATQHAEASVNRTAQIEEEKKQVILTAQGEAESMRIKANALASNPKLVEYEAVLKWNGQLPNTMLGNSTPFINLK